MTESKYCPLLSVSKRGLSPCLEIGCAWYDEARQRCEMANISTTLDTIADKLDGIDETLYRQEEGR